MPLHTLLTRARLLPVSVISDADKSLPTMDHGIHRIAGTGTIAGRAVTAHSDGDLLSVLEGLELAQPGDVLVVDASTNPTVAVAGGLFATEAHRKGLSAIIVDGLVRDLDTLRPLGFTVYARGTCPRSGPATTPPRTQVPIRCGGVNVHPGTLVLADDDGVLVTTPERLTALIDTAEAIHLHEETALAKLTDGGSLFSSMNFRTHRENVLNGTPSKLGFIA
ncbi:RraA family protein [Umezawaea endophytica]|uniref:Putative 4-hydroxy-4-methyl-2-oxoglutarate aldolase n=1 Tax=Umezawaea endophytica TaxID=1654476 RepID=A0A9X2VNC5_9PSEU|nr:RraA family protein [Umezawaea endophytica]MCS7479607.1 RraA family protein [Umezawaea endophytica]